MRQCRSCGGNCGGGYGSKPCKASISNREGWWPHTVADAKECIELQDERIAELEVENTELKEAAVRAAVLLNHATYHDGRYDQHTSFEWQEEACEVADIIERIAPQPPQQESK